VYFCYLEDMPAFISVDLAGAGVAPLQGKPYLIEVAVALQSADADGFPESQEWEVLEAIEDVLVKSFEAGLEALFVGKTLNCGRRGFYFYTGETLLVAQMMDELQQQFSSHAIVYQVKEDPAWSIYFDYLYPDEESMLRIRNNRLLQQLEEQGDQSYIPRKINYLLYFQDRADRAAAAKVVQGHGFVVEDGSTGAFPYRLCLAKISKADEETIYADTELLRQLARQYQGELDGWKTQVIREND